MKEVSFKLDKSYERPVIYITSNGIRISVLFDTGSKISVWSLGAFRLIKSFNNVKCLNKHYSFSGFGGKVIGELWQFYLDLGNGLVFPTMKAAVYTPNKDNKMPDLILGVYSMKGMSIEFNLINLTRKTVTFRINDNDSFSRNLLVRGEDGNEHVLVEDSIQDDGDTKNIAAVREAKYFIN